MGICQGEQITVATHGVTNVNHPLPVTADTLFQIGSITKTMTATIAMQLVEAGKLALDAPVRRYLPDFRLHDESTAAAVTVRQLFTHTGGWVGDYFEDTGSGDDGLARYVERMATLAQQSPLGTLWSYNNAAFSLAGRVIEVVTGQPFEAVMRDRLFAPLGMEQAFFFAGEVMTERFAVGHTVREGEEALEAEVATPWPLARSAHPAGGVSATVPDMLRYARLHLQRGQSGSGQQLLRPASVAEMQRIHATAGSMASHVGISWLMDEVAGVRTVGHGGATNGQIAQLLLVPEQAFALVILTNADRGREVTRDLSAWALEQFLGLRQSLPTTTTRPAAELAEYVGYYSAQLTDVEVGNADGGLTLQVIPKGGFPKKDSPAGPKPPIAHAAFSGTDQLLITAGRSAGSRVEFLRDERGAIAWLRLGGRIHRHQTM